jgi:hypothetical protein
MNKIFQYVAFMAVGVLFGIALTKGEIVSWYRIQEMFRFQSFHMYGVIGTAVLIGIATNQAIRRSGLKAITGQPISYHPKVQSVWRYLIGGSIFGLGWALGGACPGPMYILLGNGFSVFLVVIASALLGTYTYGLLRPRLPH